jgi:hypothetical protein
MDHRAAPLTIAGFIALILTANGPERGSVARAQGSLHFARGETLTYDVTWSVFRAGEVVTTLRTSGDSPTDYFEVEATARSHGVVSLLHKVDDEFHSTFNGSTYCSSQISKKINEGRRHKQSVVIFDTGRRLAVLDERDLAHPSDPVKHAENEIPLCVHDVVSALYFLRTQPLRVGEQFRIPVNDGAKTHDITVEVQRRDTIQPPLGRRAAFRVEAKIFRELYKKKGRVFIWISDDEQRLPLRIRVESSIGSVTGNLKSVSPLPEAASPDKS